MKIATLILAPLLSGVLGTVPASAATKVFLLAGQSNMAGHETGLPTATYNEVQTGVKYWNASSNGWTDLAPGFGCTTNDIGPEVGFGYALHNTIFPDDDIYLIKYGQDSTSLAGQWNPNGSGSAYNTFKSRVTAAMASLAGQSPTIAGMIWMQGESDAANSSFAAAYKTNLINLITTVRDKSKFGDFADPNMPFVIGRITDLSIYGFPGVADVRKAQETVPGQVGSASWINTDNLDMNPNAPGHYSAKGQIDLGMRFAGEFAPVPEPATLSLLIGTGVMLAVRACWQVRRRSIAASGIGTVLFVAAMTSLGPMVGRASAEPLRIMPLGDSITAGTTDPNWDASFCFGYRGPLYTRLTAAGYNFRFVGASPEPWNGIPYGNPPSFLGPDLRTLDQNGHRGYGGSCIADILNGNGYDPGVVAALNADNPDIVLLMIGINDVARCGNTGDTATANSHLNALVNTILTTKPDVKLIVAQINTYKDGSSTKSVEAYNDYVRETLVPTYAKQGYHITTVDQFINFTKPDGTLDQSLYSNIIHPNAAGYERVAETWFQGIQAVTPVPEPSCLNLLGVLGVVVTAQLYRNGHQR